MTDPHVFVGLDNHNLIPLEVEVVVGESLLRHIEDYELCYKKVNYELSKV